MADMKKIDKPTIVLTFPSSMACLRRSTRKAPDDGPPSRRRHRRRASTDAAVHSPAGTCRVRVCTATSSCNSTRDDKTNSPLKRDNTVFGERCREMSATSLCVATRRWRSIWCHTSSYTITLLLSRYVINSSKLFFENFQLLSLTSSLRLKVHRSTTTLNNILHLLPSTRKNRHW